LPKSINIYNEHKGHPSHGVVLIMKTWSNTLPSTMSLQQVVSTIMIPCQGLCVQTTLSTKSV
jgi:hypothetical protein